MKQALSEFFFYVHDRDLGHLFSVLFSLIGSGKPLGWFNPKSLELRTTTYTTYTIYSSPIRHYLPRRKETL